jgi:hypothetical protein
VSSWSTNPKGLRLDGSIRKARIDYSSVIPAQAGIQSLAEPIRLDSGPPLRFGWNDESIRTSLDQSQQIGPGSGHVDSVRAIGASDEGRPTPFRAG